MIKEIGLLSPVIVPMIISGLLIFSTEKNNRPKIYLSVYMLVITFVFTANYFYFNHDYEVYSWLHSLHIATVLAIYPGAYVYVKMLVAPGTPFKKLSVHFIPSLFFFFVSALIFFPFLNHQERLYFLSEYRYHPDFNKTWMKILYFVRMANVTVLFLQVFFYVFLTWKLLRRHRKTMADIFSNPERFQLNWLRFFNLSLALSALICVFLYTANPAKLFGDDRFLAYPLLLLAFILWFLGVMGNNQGLLPEVVSNDKEANFPPIQNLSTSELGTRLLSYFEEKKPYLNPDLKIWDVSAALGTNRTYISKTINLDFGQNFSSFVNSYRVKEARKLIEQDPSLPVDVIAEKVGFGSLTSLARVFFQNYGMSVAQFRKEQQWVPGISTKE